MIDDHCKYFVIILSPVVYNIEKSICTKDLWVVCLLVKLLLSSNRNKEASLMLPTITGNMKNTLALAKAQGIFTGKEIKNEMNKVNGQVYGHLFDIPNKKMINIARILLESILLSKNKKREKGGGDE